MRIVAAIVALSVSGCALVFTRGPAPGPARAEPQCSTSSAPLLLDVGGVIVWLLGIASVESLSGLPGGDDPDARQNQRTSMVLFGGLAALHAVSIVAGSGRISRCKQARDAWRSTAGRP